jgi:hypothetical protein
VIPAPRNILVSYHYFKSYDLNRFAGLRVIGDSGAFSAKSQGAEITTAALAGWAKKWRHRLCWVAALDVIGDAEGTRRNWHELVDDHGIPGVPTIHFGCDPSLMDYYVAQGVDFIGLGGLVGKPSPAQMRWLVRVFRYARDHHPDLRFHGWGVTNAEALNLPFFSVDSSGWGGGYRYGHLQLRDPRTNTVYNLDLDGRTTYDKDVATLLSREYGVSPSQVATSGPHNRLLMVRLSALSASVLEQQFRRRHRRSPVPAPHWGQLDRVDGPHYHLADTSQPAKGLEVVAALSGPHIHLAAASKHIEAEAIPALLADQLAGPHIHLAEGSSEHLETVAKMNRSMNGEPA